MVIFSRLFAGITISATLLLLQTSGTTVSNTVWNGEEGSYEGIAINNDGTIVAEGIVKDVTKADFLQYLDTHEAMLLQFYQEDSEDSDDLLKEFSLFAERAVKKYPDMIWGKVHVKSNPYLTARLLLTQIPELRFIVKGEDGKWAAYGPEIDSSEDIDDYLDNQRWFDEIPIGSAPELYCSPFNMCGRILGSLADFTAIFEDLIPLPKWLAMIVIPAVITFLGRFIIEGMYIGEQRIQKFVTDLIKRPAVQNPPQSDPSDLTGKSTTSGKKDENSNETKKTK